MAEKEYIDRDMYYQKINDFSKGGCGDYPLYCLAINDCINVLDEMPAADVAPVRHGCWVKEKSNVLIHWHCSVCEKCYFLEEPNADYCPHCGAKMDGGDLNGS